MADALTGWRKLLRDLAVDLTVDFIESGAAAKALKLVEQSLMDVLAEENESAQTIKVNGLPDKGGIDQEQAYSSWRHAAGTGVPLPRASFRAGWEAREAQR